MGVAAKVAPVAGVVALRPPMRSLALERSHPSLGATAYDFTLSVLALLPNSVFALLLRLCRATCKGYDKSRGNADAVWL